MKIVNTDQMRSIEQATDAGGQSYAAMMQMAGQAVANIAHVFMAPTPDRSILVLVGPGNNGGDGLVAVPHLMQFGHHVTVYIWKRDTKGDEHFRQLRRKRRGITILYAANDPGFAKLREELQHTDLVIDALLGTGATRPIEGQLADLLAAANEELSARRNAPTLEGSGFALGIPRLPILEAMSLGSPAENLLPPQSAGEDFDNLMDDLGDEDDIEEELWQDDDELPDWVSEDEPPGQIFPEPAILAVDCPSGLNCDTGALDPATLSADMTVTFGLPKWGQLQHPGAAACGLLAVSDIGIPLELSQQIQAEIVESRQVAAWLPHRPVHAHKGTFGQAMIVAGSLNYTGAAYLSAAAALRAGAGLVSLAIPAPLHAALAGVLPEITWLPLAAPEGVHTVAGIPKLLPALASYDALLIGPGLTTSAETRAFMAALLQPDGLQREAWQGRTVVDADALNILAALPDWPTRLPPLSILTPHPGEMARLTGRSPEQINAQRIEAARHHAAEWGHVVVLKGAHTVIAEPGGRIAVLPFALSVLATAGSGDVLAGAIVAMLAQGLQPFEAAVCAAYLHGHAGQIVGRTAGTAGAMAHDFIDRFPEALRHLYALG
jgi:NAD(P)H-hydrate epimerase